MCPVCDVGIIVGLGLSRWLKVDDSISGLWIGSLLFITAQWLYNLLLKKIKFPNKIKIIVGVLSLVFIWAIAVIPLYFTGIINKNCTTILGIDRLNFGIYLGIIIFGLAVLIDQIIRKNNHNKAIFKYQKVIIPLGLLIIVSLILNFSCK